MTVSADDEERKAARNNGIPKSTTFSQLFVKEGISDSDPQLSGKDYDLSGKQWVWVEHPETAFVKGFVLKEEGDLLHVRCTDDSDRMVPKVNANKVNPRKFDRANDMAELTHLNEASVVHNLASRYQADLIYTYSGLFLVAVNPYCSLPIYGKDSIKFYQNRSREDGNPHVFATADLAYRNMLEMRENQSILVTGESGAGKTENTKKVIRYLAAVASDQSQTKDLGTLEQQILQANPILESFGNSQTVRNNNSSRFGKFIRVEFTRTGQIAGAFIDWYLLEKSRVVHQNSNERNYHIFYQLLKGADPALKRELLLDGDWRQYGYIKNSNKSIPGVDDSEDLQLLERSFDIMGFSKKEQMDIYRIIAAVLHIGNLTVEAESSDQARLPDLSQAERLCHLLGISMDQFVKGLLRPRVKAGREWINQGRNADQVLRSLEALAKSLYERAFGHLVSKINAALERSADFTSFIGVLDIAGFEIFEKNSFEQLCINYTNERLQQFFNHHMFVLEQEEYARENIEWKFIDFGQDLQPTIDLIEKSKPIGVFSCLDEDCVVPKATDKTFTEKLNGLWEKKSPSYKRSLLQQGFILRHYAAEVEYSTDGWLEKNKDPLNDNVTLLLTNSTEKCVASLFVDCTQDITFFNPKSRVKKGLFRTVAQRHKEQLATLMNQLNSTRPHFIRCIIPNHEKRPKKLHAPSVLDQLRCNGVLEGIRIARTGFPNRLQFSGFRQRYGVLCPKLPEGYMDGHSAVKLILEKIGLDESRFRVGLTKVFFRAGVLAELEEQRDGIMRGIVTSFQSVARGWSQRKWASKRLFRSDATKIIQKNFRVYLDLSESPWFKIYLKMRPLLSATRTDAEVRSRDEAILKLESKVKDEEAEKKRIEEERKRIDQDLAKVQEMLENERTLAIDKEELLSRANGRVSDLEEQVNEAQCDIDRLEEQCEELLDARRRGDSQIAILREQLLQGASLIAKLEQEKQEYLQRMGGLQSQLSHVEVQHESRNSETDKLDQEIKLLKSSLHHKEKKIAELEKRLFKSDTDLEANLKESAHNYESSNKRVVELVAENKQIRAQLAELSATSADYENLVRKKESELAVIRADLARQAQDKKILDQEKKILQSKHDAVALELKGMKEEVTRLRTSRDVLEKEAAEARSLLNAKNSEGTSSARSHAMMDKQIAQLKSQLSGNEAIIQQNCVASIEESQKKDLEIRQLTAKYNELLEAKIVIQKELDDRQNSLEAAEAARAAADRTRKEIVEEINQLRHRATLAENAQGEAESLHRQLQKQLRELTARSSSSEERFVATVKENKCLQSQLTTLHSRAQDHENSRNEIKQLRNRLTSELEALRESLSCEKRLRSKVQSELETKSAEISQFKARTRQEHASKLNIVQAQKDKYESEVKEWQKKYSQLLLSKESLYKQKERFTVEIEDLNHEVSRQQQLTRSADKLASSLQLQLAEVNRSLEGERQQRIQSQAVNQKLQNALDVANSEVNEHTQQLLTLQRVLDTNTAEPEIVDDNGVKERIKRTVDLAKELESAVVARKVAEEGRGLIRKQFEDARKRWHVELAESDNLHTAAREAFLEELSRESNLDPVSPPRRLYQSNAILPNRQGSSDAFIKCQNSFATFTASDLGDAKETQRIRRVQDLQAEVETLETKLDLSERRRRELESRVRSLDIPLSLPKTQAHSSALEQENERLHELLDNNANTMVALEQSQKSGLLNLRDLNGKSNEEVEQTFNKLAESRKMLFSAHKITSTELTHAKAELEKAKKQNAVIQNELKDTKDRLVEEQASKDSQEHGRNQLLTEFADIQIRLDAESGRASDLEATLTLYKRRAEEYFNRLESAEMAVLKASKSENWAKMQWNEAEEALKSALADRSQTEEQIQSFSKRIQDLEEKMEESGAELEEAQTVNKRLQYDLDNYRNSHTQDLEERGSSLEQTRKKYQRELENLAAELETERTFSNDIRKDNRQLRDELDAFRSKWDVEALSRSSWAKEKSRMESKLAGVAKSHEDAVKAHNDSQEKVASLLSQIRTLRTTMDETATDRDQLQADKRSLEKRLTEASQRLEDLAKGSSPHKLAANQERDISNLKATLAQQEDTAAAAVEKMRRAEALATETHKDITAERERNMKLHNEKADLEKNCKELQLRIVDLETQTLSNSSKDVKFLKSRVAELEKELDSQSKERNENQKSVRNVDRTLRELQNQVTLRENTKSRLEGDLTKSEARISRLKKSVEELNQRFNYRQDELNAKQKSSVKKLCDWSVNWKAGKPDSTNL